MNENRWKLWRMYAAGLPAMQFRHCRDAFYRTQMESPQNSDPDRFRGPKDLMTVQSQELAGVAARRYIFPEPFVFDRQPEVERYDDEYVIRMIVDAGDGQMGIGCVVNAIVWFNLLWLNRASIVAQLRAMEPSNKGLDAIRWMELDLPKSQMPAIASRLEEIIDSIKMNGKSVEWANAAITEFRNTCPVAPKFWWQGGFQGEGRIPWHRRGNYNEPIPVTTAI